MRRFLRLLLIVALPALVLTPAIAGDYDTSGYVWAEVVNIKEIPGTTELIIQFVLFPNENQMCVCQLKTPQIKCLCEQPKQGLCYEIES